MQQRHHFISYSNADGVDFATKLHDALEGGHPKHPAWMDKHDLKPGIDWDIQLRDAIGECDTLLFAMTPDSVSDNSVCRDEWTQALKYKKIVVPLLVSAGIEAPFRLGNRQYIDFSTDFDAAMARLRTYLAWLKSPAGELQRMKDQRADAERDLRRAQDAVERKRIEAEIAQLIKDIARQQEIVDNPAAAAARTQASIDAGIERERQPREKPATRTKFINPPPATAPDYFQDRHAETKLTGDFLRDPALRLMTIVGRAGVGKTAMTCRLLKALEGGKLPDSLGDLPVDGIVYLSAVGSRRVTMPNLFADLARLLPDEVAEQLDAVYRNPQASAEEKMRALLSHFSPEKRVVLLLDNFEDIVDHTTFAITDDELDEALRALLSLPEHAVKVIITTRVKPRALLTHRFGQQRVLELDKGLESPYAENILRELDHDGTLGLRDLPENDPLLAEARDRTRGYPRALEALAAILAADRSTTLPEMLDNIRKREDLAGAAQLLPDEVVEQMVGEAFNRLDTQARQVMQALAIYARPVTPVAVDYLLQDYAPGIDSAAILGRLVNMHFARKEGGRYYLHPVDRAYASGRVERGEVSDRYEQGITPFTQIGLAHRGAEYFKSTRKPRAEWKTLEDLTPQLAEFDLRYAAEDYDTAASVLLEIDFDYLLLWGYFRLMAGLHERLQGKIGDPELNLLSVGNLGIVYRNMGRITGAINCYERALVSAREHNVRWSEGALLGNLGLAYADLGDFTLAINSYQQALAIARDIGDRRGEANHLGNLGSVYMSMGDYSLAIDHHQQALAIARDISDQRGEGSHLGNLGNAYSELGDFTRAIDHYQQALAIQRDIGNQLSQGIQLGNLGETHRNMGDYSRAIDFFNKSLAIARDIGDQAGIAFMQGSLGSTYTAQTQWSQTISACKEALKIADETGIIQIQSSARHTLAFAYLCSGDLTAARTTIDAARQFDYPPNNHNAASLLGVISLRQNDRTTAQNAFADAVTKADEKLAQTDQNVGAHYVKALAFCGLALCEGAQHLAAASESYHAGRALTAAAGIIHEELQLFDALALADTEGILTPVRRVIAGKE